MFEQSAVSARPATLWRALIDVLEDARRLEAMRRAAEARGNPRAAEDIAAELVRLMEAP